MRLVVEVDIMYDNGFRETVEVGEDGFKMPFDGMLMGKRVKVVDDAREIEG